MHHRIRRIAVSLALLCAVVSVTALSACGSDSAGQANALLKQTFGGTHKVDSGNLTFNLTLSPAGSRTLTSPLMFGFGGPFQSLGTGKLPASNFTITVAGLGRQGSLGLLSTGQSGFVSLQGTSYQMPAATFQRLESSFAGLTSSAGGGSGSGALARLGINPLRWLLRPSIAGQEKVGGTGTTHIRAGVNVAALLSDLNTFLQKASSLGVPSAGRISTTMSAATETKIANEIQNPRFDVWTGNSDKTPRKLAIELTLPVTGQISTLLGGLRSANVALSMQYGDLNQPQTITAPGAARPFGEFTAKLKAFEQSLQSVIAGTFGPGGSGSSGSSTTGTGSAAPGTGTSGSAAPSTGTTGSAAPGTPSNVQSYGQCIQAAGTDVTKMQSCASLLQAK